MLGKPMLVDSHCHLDFPDFAEELDEVVARAHRAGIGLMVTICTRLDKFDQVLAVAERFPGVYCSVGVHPHEAESDWGRNTDRLIEAARHPKVIGIGETGLDYYYEHAPRDAQMASFRSHIQAARVTGLPLIVHTRDADEDTVRILSEEMEKGRYTGLIHCFSGTSYLAEKSTEIGMSISLSGILTFKSAASIRETVSGVPLDRLLVETDAPYLAPIPNRGKRNEPAFTAHTARLAAELKGVSEAAFADATTANFFRLFTKAAPEAAQRAA